MGEVSLPGTQPLELTVAPAPTANCGCHDAFDPVGFNEPGQSYRATAMALSGRDPLFRAALAVSHQDHPELSDLCIRCHMPVGWLSGRSTPGDASALTPEDIDSGVACDICHRMVPTDPPLIGSGQYTLSPMGTKRARRGRGELAPHPVAASDFIASAEMCGRCHSLFNPAENAHDAAGEDLGTVYYEQRTYEEWADSSVADRATCVDCHMKTAHGAAARNGAEYDDLSVHSFVGGNSFVMMAARALDPMLPIAREIPVVTEWIDASLRSAATLEIRDLAGGAGEIEGGASFGLSVRLTNLTGHKLPTGYPEGRRVYLEVTLRMEADDGSGGAGEGGASDEEPIVLSGAWDETTGDLIYDDQLRTYETEHGAYAEGVGGQRTHHLLLMNQILSDTRIPPEGFEPRALDMVPSGRDYGAAPPYRNYDDVTYHFAAPTVTSVRTATLTVRAMYQSVDGQTVRFLVDEAMGTQEGDDLDDVWRSMGPMPPAEMAVATAVITVKPSPLSGVSDAGTNDGGFDDEGGVGADAAPGANDDQGGCGCTAVGRGSGTELGRAMLDVGRPGARGARDTRGTSRFRPPGSAVPDVATCLLLGLLGALWIGRRAKQTEGMDGMEGCPVSRSAASPE